jgi:arylsulfatase A-like enzyme
LPLLGKDVASARSEWFNNRMTRFLTVFLCWASLAMAGDKALRPNIILILADDMGFSDIGCYGGEIQTPNLDQLAEHGLRYTQFYNTARCCPTRASLMTGLYAHQAGMGAMTRPSQLRGYQGHINRNCVTIAEVLKQAGYATFMSGKWHLTEDKNKLVTGSKHNWPRQRGFDRFFGTIAGAGSFYTPQTLTLDNAPITEFPKDFYYTTAIGEHGAQFIREHGADENDQPFFLYVPFTAPHWPLHALEKDIKKYRGKYLKGWDAIRAERHVRQLEMGLVDQRWPISPRHERAPAWETLDKAKRTEMDERMAIYAAMIDSMDQAIGRILKAVAGLGQTENTMVLFLADNGGCDESGLYGFERKKGGKLGTDSSFASYGLCWANASNTPFQFFKKDNHEGGIASPLIVHWPEGIEQKDHGKLRHEPTHVIDIMATAVQLAGAEYPARFRGHEILPLEGRSLLPTFEGKPLDRTALYWEHVGNRAVRSGDWKLVANTRFRKQEWELYNLRADRTETVNLINQREDKAQELKTLWQAWATRAYVLPKPGGKKSKK